MLLRLVVLGGSCIFGKFLLWFLWCSERRRRQCGEGGGMKTRDNKQETWYCFDVVVDGSVLWFGCVFVMKMMCSGEECNGCVIMDI